MGHEGKDYYEILELDPQQRRLADFALKNSERNFPVLGLFPFQDLEDQVKREPKRPFIVDIAGSMGQSLLKIRQACTFGGRLILQDLPVVINSLKPEDIPGIEAMAYNMLTPQPIKSKHSSRSFYYERRLKLCIKMLMSTLCVGSCMTSLIK
jgi:hypothetical protein